MAYLLMVHGSWLIAHCSCYKFLQHEGLKSWGFDAWGTKGFRYGIELGEYRAMKCVSGKKGCRGFLTRCQSKLGYMRIVVCYGLVDAAKRLQCMACCGLFWCDGVNKSVTGPFC